MNGDTMTNEMLLRGRIDRLVCGELGDAERRELLAWLEGDVVRWRQCAMAFLEAQVWEETLEAEGSGFRVQRSAGSGPRSVVRSQTTGAEAVERTGGRGWLAPLLVVAASIAAFTCGLLFQELRLGPRQSAPPIAQPDSPAQRPPATSGPLVASVPVKGGPLGNIAATLQFPVRPLDSAAIPAASSVPDHVRRQWERRGYELVEERRYLPARLPDGRQVMVPVNEVKMKFVGKPVS